MKRLCLFFVLILLGSGCTSYRALKHFNKSEAYSQAVKYSKKIDILEKNEIKTMFYVTFMNKVLEEYNDKNYNFVIAIYSENESIFDYKITLNSNNYISLVEMNNNDKIFDNISLKNKWAKKYYISFKKENDIKKLKFNFLYQKVLNKSVSFID
ncbi:MAG: hypothetical protein HRT40_12050 [Campylobacteraceae bacterium]|nr:hypothetical protein [Campylobacteraceae bacterium]